jgi:single-strand DNA-binding protein
MYQQLTLVGNLGSDPVMRYTSSGVPVASFSLAVSRSWTNQEGQRQEKTIWFRVTAWRKLAELVSQYLTKGRQVLVVGEIEEPRTYTDRDGNTRVSLDVTANQVRFLGTRADNEAGGGGSFSGSAPSDDDDGAASDEDIPF